MTSFRNLYLAISDSLGWNAMPAKTAIPAISRIIEASGIQDAKSVAKFYDGELFLFLIYPFENLWDIKNFLDVRSQIESEMLNGVSHEEAIRKWFR